MEGQDIKEVKTTPTNEEKTTSMVSNEYLLQKMEELSKQFIELKNNKFDASEINTLAKQKAFEKSVELEQGFMESEKIQRIQQKGQTDLQIRNALWERSLEEFMEGNIPSSFFRSIDSKTNPEHSHLLGACLYRYLAPKYGVSIEYLDSTSLIEAEKEFNWKNQPGNLIRSFRG